MNFLFDNDYYFGNGYRQGPRGLQGVAGPQGEKGESGPAGTADTITIRNTTTGEAETNAEVVDVTGSPNHVLDFIIPKGSKGDSGEVGPPGEKGEIGPQGLPGEKGEIGPQGAPGEKGEIGPQGAPGEKGETGPQGAPGEKGEIGPQGLQGEKGETGPQGIQGIDGVSDRINISETKTGDAGTLAMVEDDFTMGVHNLTFTIPKGDAAPVSDLSIAQLYKTTTQTLTAIGQSVEFSINQNFRNSLTTQSTIQVRKEGAYKIEFGFTFSSLTDVVMTLYINDLEMNNTRLTFDAAIKNNSGVFLVVLDANDELSMRVQQISGDAVLTDGVLNGYLIVTPAG